MSVFPISPIFFIYFMENQEDSIKFYTVFAVEQQTSCFIKRVPSD